MSAYRFNKLWWFLGILGLAIIAGGSLMPADTGPQVFPNSDKLVHFTGYAIATYYFQQLTKNQKLITIFFILWFYSGAIEVIQGQFPTRQMSLGDLIANGCGGLFGSFLSVKFLKEVLFKFDRILSDRLSR